MSLAPQDVTLDLIRRKYKTLREAAPRPFRETSDLDSMLNELARAEESIEDIEKKLQALSAFSCNKTNLHNERIVSSIVNKAIDASIPLESVPKMPFSTLELRRIEEDLSVLRQQVGHIQSLFTTLNESCEGSTFLKTLDYADSLISRLDPSFLSHMEIEYAVRFDSSCLYRVFSVCIFGTLRSSKESVIQTYLK